MAIWGVEEIPQIVAGSGRKPPMTIWLAAALIVVWGLVAAILSSDWLAWVLFGVDVVFVRLLLGATRIAWLITIGAVVVGVPVGIAASEWWLVPLNLVVFGLLISPSTRRYMRPMADLS